jgi:hypothetical protein
MNKVEQLLARKPDLAAKSAEVNEQWRDHLARWARNELRRRHLHMDPDGKVHPLPTLSRREGGRIRAASKVVA